MRPIHSALIAILLIVTGCAEKEVLLTGERTDLRTAIGAEAPVRPVNQSPAIRLPAQTTNNAWPQRAGSATHTIRHPSFSTAPRALWQVNIGSGNDRRHQISADPVAAGGLIFTLDSRATVTATSASGVTAWSRDLTPAGERADDGSGGGLAVVDGKLFVTTGFSQLVALNAASGNDIWRQNLNAPAMAAPTVSNGVVYIVSRDSRGWAFDAATGRVRWQLQGAPSTTGVVGGASPAVGGNIVVFPMGSTELLATFPKSGLQIWSSIAAGSRLGRVYAGVSDISADPVIVGNTVFVGTPSGRAAALDASDGKAIWTIEQGATGPMIVEGGSVFMVTDKSELRRVNASTGETIWSVTLPYFVPVRKASKIRDVFPHYGPVLAGGRLWVASGDGLLRGFDPSSGGLAATIQMGDTAASRPVVVGGTLYLVGQSGTLMAFR